MNQNEAQRIAAAINILRPEWSTKLLMMVLGDERMIRRPYADALIALTVCALDNNTIKPGRVHELGPWWAVASAASRTGSSRSYITPKPGVCAICDREKSQHDGADHSFDSPFERTAGVGPTPEQKAAIEAARVEALAARPEPKPKRKPRDPAEVIATHTSANNEEIAS